MENPVLSVCRIRSCLICKEELLSSDVSKADQQEHPRKKAKVIPACSVSISLDTSLYEGKA